MLKFAFVSFASGIVRVQDAEMEAALLHALDDTATQDTTDVSPFKAMSGQIKAGQSLCCCPKEEYSRYICVGAKDHETYPIRNLITEKPQIDFGDDNSVEVSKEFGKETTLELVGFKRSVSTCGADGQVQKTLDGETHEGVVQTAYSMSLKTDTTSDYDMKEASDNRLPNDDVLQYATTKHARDQKHILVKFTGDESAGEGIIYRKLTDHIDGTGEVVERHFRGKGLQSSFSASAKMTDGFAEKLGIRTSTCKETLKPAADKSYVKVDPCGNSKGEKFYAQNTWTPRTRDGKPLEPPTEEMQNNKGEVYTAVGRKGVCMAEAARRDAEDVDGFYVGTGFVDNMANAYRNRVSKTEEVYGCPKGMYNSETAPPHGLGHFKFCQCDLGDKDATTGNYECKAAAAEEAPAPAAEEEAAAEEEVAAAAPEEEVAARVSQAALAGAVEETAHA